MALKRLPNGLWAVEPRRREFYGLVHQLLPLAASALGTVDNVTVDGQADFLIRATAALADFGQAKVNFIIQPDRNLFQTPVWIDALGIGQFPRILAGPKLVPRSQTLTMQAYDRQTVAGPNNIRVLHIGEKVYDNPFEQARAYRTVDEYDYVANFTGQSEGQGQAALGPLAANQTLVFPIPIFADADFDCYKVSIFADGEATLQVAATGKALDWFNRPCAVSLLGATTVNPRPAIPSGSWPFRLPSPFRIPAAGAIMVTVADLSGLANSVMVIFHGLRMKPPGGLPVDPRSLVNLNVGTGA